MDRNQIMNIWSNHKLIIGVTICAIVIGLLVASGWSKGNAPAPAPGPPEVEVARVEQRSVPIYSEWIGTLDGMVNAEIRAQVAGYLLKQYYTEGSFVKKGQLLFEIDPRPFQAALDQAKGELDRKSTRLNSSHLGISYAVFCLKKK